MGNGLNGQGGPGVLPSTGIAVASDAFIQAIIDAQIAKGRYGNLVGLGSGVADDGKVQSVVDTLAAAPGWGSVELSAGHFYIANYINLKSPVGFHGRGSSGAYNELTAKASTILVHTGAGHTMVFSEENYVGDVGNFRIDGASTAIFALAPRAQGAHFHDIDVYHCADVGFYLAATATYHPVQNLFENIFVHDMIAAPNGAVVLNGFDAAHPVTLNVFINCRFNNGVNGTITLRLITFSDSNFWLGGRIEGPQNGITVTLSEQNAIDDGVYNDEWRGTSIEGLGNATTLVNAQYNKTRHLFAGCAFAGTYGTLLTKTSNSKIAFSQIGLTSAGTLSENSGASVGTGVQQTIAHGLCFTPTRAQISLTGGSATALPFHSADPDATNIKVTATLNQAWYWATAGK